MRPSVSGKWLAIVAAGAIAAGAHEAHAQDRGGASAADTREGRTAFEQAFRAFQALDYASALPLFQRAYVLTQNPGILFNIGATLEALGRNAEAATAFRHYAGAVPDAPNRADAEARAGRLEAASAASSGPPRVYSVEQPRVVVGSPAPLAVAAPARPMWPFVVLGVGVAAGIAGAVTLALAPDPGATQHASESDYLRALDAANGQRIAGGVVIGIGAAAIVAGVAGVLLRPSAPRRDHAFHWGAAPTADGAMITVGWRGRGL